MCSNKEQVSCMHQLLMNEMMDNSGGIFDMISLLFIVFVQQSVGSAK